MTPIILLFAIGIVFLAVEVIVPGAILGSIGALLMFAGSVLAFLNYGTGGGIIAVLSCLAICGLVFFFEFKILPKTKLGKRAFLTTEITGVASALGEEARGLIGKSAQALTMLSPSGYVIVDGQRYEAFCQTGQAPAGSDLEIVDADNFRLIVTHTTPN
jgi:membrane-bound serine protease (ClpP class)